MKLIVACVLLVYCFVDVAAQQSAETREEFWPEVDVYVKLDARWKLFFLARMSTASEADGPYQGQVGAHVDYSKNDRWSFRAGYRYVFSLTNSDPKEHRVVLEETLRLPLPAKISLADRNRQELRFVNGDFSARFRNRATFERELSIRRYKFSPYASAEIFYDTRFNTFNRLRLAFGAKLPLLIPAKSALRDHVSLDAYYLRQDDTRSQPKHLNVIGVKLILNY